MLDGPVDADEYINDPVADLHEQTAAFERALGRFFAACAAEPGRMRGLRRPRPVGRLRPARREGAATTPIPARRYTPDPRPVDGDDINAVAVSACTPSSSGPRSRRGCARPTRGDGTLIRAARRRAVLPRDPETGEYDPCNDRYFVAIGGGEAEVAHATSGSTCARARRRGASTTTPSSTSGYTELGFGLWPVRAQDAYSGPFHVEVVRAGAAGGRTRPTTPRRRTAARKMLVRELGNARLLTMRGDGHTAYGGNSPCIDARWTPT